MELQKLTNAASQQAERNKFSTLNEILGGKKI